MRVIASFTVDSVDEMPPQGEEDTTPHNRARLKKTYRGDNEGQSSTEMLAVRNDAGAGYVALEHFSGSVGGTSGGFALLHIGTIAGGEQWARWPLVPGAGTGALSTIRGEGRIDIDDTQGVPGGHTFTLDYELD